MSWEPELEELRRREEVRARQEARTHEEARDIAARLEQTVLRFDVKAGPTGSLFGSVTPTDIVEQLWAEKKIRVDRRKVGVDPIKRIGRYELPIALFEDVRVDVKTLVVPVGGELPPEEELEQMAAEEAAEAAAAEEARKEEARQRAEAEQAALEALKEENPEAYEKPVREDEDEEAEEAQE